MPKCYLLAVARGSALDQSTNTWSIFNLVEEVALGALTEAEVNEQAPLVPLEIHTYWYFDEAERGTPYEFRIIAILPDGRGSMSDPRPLSTNAHRHRIRNMGFRVPGIGTADISVEWRAIGDEEWTRVESTWPLTISVGAPEPQPALELGG